MRKLILTTAALLALASPSLAPAEAQEGCITPDMISAKAIEKHLPIFYTLHGVDLGFEDEVDVVIFESGDAYLAIAFYAGCYITAATFDQAGVEQFINENTKKADGV